MSEPSSRSLEQARELLHGRVFEEAQIAVALALDEIVALRQRCALHDDLEFVSANELKNARAEAWAEGFEAAKAVVIAMSTTEKIGESEERTTPPNPGAAEG